MNVNLKSLVGRLNDTCHSALDNGVGLCVSRTNYDVEIEHILAKLLEQDDTDLQKIARHYEVNIDRLNKDVMTALDSLKTGNSRPTSRYPSLSSSSGLPPTTVQSRSLAAHPSRVSRTAPPTR